MLQLNLFGYDNSNRESPLVLREVTIQADPQTLRRLSEFLSLCAAAIENDRLPDGAHQHFGDYLKLELPVGVDIIVAR